MASGDTASALESLKRIRPEVDEVILELWNQIEAHFKDEPAEARFDMCRKFGVVYYYRKNEVKVVKEDGGFKKE